MSFLRRELLPILAALIVLVVLFARLGELPFRDPDEGRNAQVASEMHQSGAWLLPTYDGQAYLDKPAFFFKAVALSYTFFGESEATARLPSVFFALLLLAMLFAFCRREYPDRSTASLAVIVCATSPLFLALARHVIFDMTLACFVSGAIFACYLAETSEGRTRRNWYLLGAAAAGLATLVKGPVGFVIPLLVVVVFNLVDGRKGWAGRAFSPWNILVFLAIVLPWFIGLSLVRPDFPYYGLVEETFHRFTSTKAINRGGPFYYYGLVLLGGFFAWSLLFPEAVARVWSQRHKLARADRFFIVWTLVVVIFFSISKSKLPHYILTVSVTLAALVARLFVVALANRTGSAARLIFRGLLFLALFCLPVAGFLFLESFSPGAYERMGLKGREFNRLTLLFEPTAIVLLIIAAMAAFAAWRRDVRVAFATFLLLPVLLLTADFNALKAYSEASSSRQIVLGIPPLPPDTQIVCYRAFPPGLLFYLKKEVTLISTDGSELTSNYVIFTLKKPQPWPDRIVPLDKSDAWLKAQTKPVFLMTNKATHDDLARLAHERHAEPAEFAPGWWGVLLAPGTN